MRKIIFVSFVFIMLHLLFGFSAWAQDTITVTDPNGGENITVGTSYDIQWTTTGTIVDVKIEYSADGGSTWNVIAYVTDNDGTYSWTVPYTVSTNCLVRISDVDGDPSDESDAEFSIDDDGTPRIRVTSPNGCETLVGGSTYEITWLSTGTVGDVHIEYSTDDGTSWSDVAATTDNDGSYDWTVPGTVSSQYLVRISEASDGNPNDESDANFAVVSSSSVINLAFPNGGESLPTGTVQTIAWSSSGTVANVKLEYSTNNGSSWKTIVSSTPDDGSYNWTVPLNVSSQCLVRISNTAGGSPSDHSGTTFSIVRAGTPAITVTSPNGGNYLWAGVPWNINWDAVGDFSDVHIEYSTDNGGTWADIRLSTGNDGVHSWLVPDEMSDQCLVRISDAADGDPTDVSDAVFSIQKSLASITITSPQGGEYWQAGTVHTITWTSFQTVGDVKIQYSTDNMSTWTTIINSTANDGSYPWTVSNTPSSNCFVKVSEAADGDPYNVNYTAFTISSGSQGPEIGLNRTELYFATVKSSTAKTPAQDIVVTNSSGAGTLKWQVTADDLPWIRFTPTVGTQAGSVSVSVEPSALAVGTYSGTLTFTDQNASNSPQTVDVYLTVYAVLTDSAPFGSFETPLDGSTVSSSIPVTGWALDDIGVETVGIYRDPVQGEGSGLIYIGDAVQVEGARPDVEQSYPVYPMSYKAGWGYMMLTNFLPNGGNGTFTLYAYAEDGSGHSVQLGTRTITCDNAHAVKPFGAIDTPAQGGQASGDEYRNVGWVLTPMPNYIPTNGSTIKVYVDGVSLGNPTYSGYREDVAALFPGYANSNGAQAYMDIDTTVYENGVHTIQWVATDNAGNSDGIGSRYFSVRNTGYYRQNWAGNMKPGIIPAKMEKLTVVSRELERMEINLFPPARLKTCTGYLKVGDEVKPLPVGSYLDSKIGVFYWQPGPGFNGTYELVFYSTDDGGNHLGKSVFVTIKAKFE